MSGQRRPAATLANLYRGRTLGFRFRKSIRLAPGIRLNFSSGGTSLSLGPRGATINYGKRGTFLNTGLPGTGMSFRQRLDAPSPDSSPRSEPPPLPQLDGIPSDFMVSSSDDGLTTLKHMDGTPLHPSVANVLYTQSKQSILEALATICEQRNNAIEALGKVHEAIVPPGAGPRYEVQTFTASPPPKPAEPVEEIPGVVSSLFSSRREAIANRNDAAREAYESALISWKQEVGRLAHQKVAHDKAQKERKLLFEQRVLTETQAMLRVLELRMEEIEWPRETTADFDVSEDGREVYLDVDLPEIEDMPTETYVVAKRDMALNKKDMPQTRVRALYMRHIHSVALRMLGVVFNCLPKAETVVLSGYSQRINKSAGHVGNEYLYSARVTRSSWLRLNLADPAAIDPVEAFDGFEIRRNMTKTGVFKPIEPFEITVP